MARLLTAAAGLAALAWGMNTSTSIAHPAVRQTPVHEVNARCHEQLGLVRMLEEAKQQGVAPLE